MTIRTSTDKELRMGAGYFHAEGGTITVYEIVVTPTRNSSFPGTFVFQAEGGGELPAGPNQVLEFRSPDVGSGGDSYRFRIKVFGAKMYGAKFSLFEGHILEERP